MTTTMTEARIDGRKASRAYFASLFNDEYHGILTLEENTVVFYVEDTGERKVLDLPTFQQWCVVHGEIGLAASQAIIDHSRAQAEKALLLAGSRVQV